MLVEGTYAFWVSSNCKNMLFTTGHLALIGITDNHVNKLPSPRARVVKEICLLFIVLFLLLEN